MNEKIKTFIKKYSIKILDDFKKGIQLNPFSFSDCADEVISNFQYTPKYEKIYTIEISEYYLQYLSDIDSKVFQYNSSASRYLEDLLMKENKEKQLRDKYPALQEAYEKYTSILSLIS